MKAGTLLSQKGTRGLVGSDNGTVSVVWPVGALGELKEPMRVKSDPYCFTWVDQDGPTDDEYVVEPKDYLFMDTLVQVAFVPAGEVGDEAFWIVVE